MYPLRPRPYRREGIAWLPYAIGAGRLSRPPGRGVHRRRLADLFFVL